MFTEYKKQGVLYSQVTVIKETPWEIQEFPALDLHGSLLDFFGEIKNKL